MYIQLKGAIFMSSDNMPPSTIAMQEEAMWAEYRASQQVPVEECPEAVDQMVYDAESSCGRFSVTDTGPSHLYPSEKDGQTTKDRRYLPQVKFSDRGKALGKTPGGKDKSFRQLKHEGFSADSV